VLLIEANDNPRPVPKLNQVEERLEHLCSHNGNNQKLLVRAKYFSRAVEMDEQGRVLIPIVLRSSARMKSGVDILDHPNYLEVWNHAQFLKDLKSSPITAQDEKMLSKLSSAPRFPRIIRRNKEEGHVHGTEMRFRIHRRASGFTGSSEPSPYLATAPWAQDGAPGAENTSPNSSAPGAYRKVSLSVCLPTDRVGLGRKRP